MRRIVFLTIALFLLADLAAAQNVDDMTERLQAALKQNDTALALKISNDLYDVSDENEDHQSAGFSAYVKAGLLEQESRHLEAAKAYDLCAKHYQKIESLAQSIQCQYKSALALLAGYKQGQAVDALKDTAKSLEKIGQDKSALAAQVYMTLSNEVLPVKTDHSRGANRNRLMAAEYARKSLLALKATGQDKSEDYVSASFMKALALEDAEEFEEAAESYIEAITLYKSLPNHSVDVLRNMQSRLSIAQFGVKGGSDDDTIDVDLLNGEEITLEIIKKKTVKIPRINKNQMVDGARVRARIHLSDNGKVDHIEILESMPSDEFGDAFKKAVKKWQFLPPEEFAGETIPPFEYSMVFYVKRL
jgi:TonB family protein